MSDYVYVLWSKKLNKRYVGSCRDVDKRIQEHNRGKQRFTCGGVPWVLLHTEEFATYGEARRRELFLKSGKGREWLDRINYGEVAEWTNAADC